MQSYLHCVKKLTAARNSCMYTNRLLNELHQQLLGEDHHQLLQPADQEGLQGGVSQLEEFQAVSPLLTQRSRSPRCSTLGWGSVLQESVARHWVASVIKRPCITTTTFRLFTKKACSVVL